MDKIITNISTIFTSKGMDSASQYIILVSFVLGLFALGWYFRYILASAEKQREEERKLQKEERDENSRITNKVLEMFEQNSNRQYEAMIKINENIIEEVKNISNCIREGIDTMNDSITEMIEKSNEKLISTIDEEKTVSLSEFESQSKALIEICLRRINNSINERIEKNNLVKLKSGLRGSQECCYLDGELASITKKHWIDIKSKIKEINYQEEHTKLKIITEYDNTILNMNMSLCNIFDVEETYSKDDLYRAVRALVEHNLNIANAIDFGDI